MLKLKVYRGCIGLISYKGIGMSGAQGCDMGAYGLLSQDSFCGRPL